MVRKVKERRYNWEVSLAVSGFGIYLGTFWEGSFVVSVAVFVGVSVRVSGGVSNVVTDQSGVSPFKVLFSAPNRTKLKS